VAAIKYKRFASQHTYMNKASGLAVFTIPFAIVTVIAVPYCWGVCVVAMAASLEEFVIHLISREYNPRKKTILSKGY
jgi:CDP-diacylglycerol--glycerol-3-phosphate 3-phosphatidyltransferase